MANLAIIGRHALLFDDDSGANFVNSPAALVPWGADPSLLIDRHDVRHLLDRVPPRPKPGFVYRSEDEVAEELVADRERFLDLPSEDASVPDESEETNQTQGAYAAVYFSYGTTGEDTKSGSELKLEGSESCYRPPFPLPDTLLNNLPPSEKVHQIIARTAKFVSEHGGQSEIVLRVKQGNNPTFGFLMPDHHLHPYFRFLVDNPNVLNKDASGDKGALSLLGSVYDSGEDEDAVTASPSNTHPIPKGMESEKNVMKQEEKETPILTEERPALAKKNPSIAKINPSIAKAKVKEGTGNVGPSKPQVVMMEPSSVMKIAMEKIAEFIRRNGRELEAVLINQDRSTNNFPFLVPTNAYHPYYLKILEEAKERKDSTEKKGREPTPPSQAVSREPSEEPAIIPEKFKMSIGKTKKTERTESTNQNSKAGLSTQEAAAIVNAAIRGVSPSFRPEPPKADSVQSGAARTKPSGIDEDWIAKTIAKTAALVSSEAASVSKEEKIKAERLKKAKMFASMIKNSGDSGGAPPLPLLLNKVESSKVEDDKGLGSKNEVNGGDSSLREKLEKGRSEREKRHHEKNYRKPDNIPESETSERKREKYSDEETCDESPGHGKKRRKHKHGGERHKRYHSSSDEERERTERKRRGHSPDDREGHVSKREKRRHRKNYSSSDSEEESRHHRRSHRDERRRSSSRRSDSEEESRHHRRSHRDERRRSSSRRPDSEEESRRHRRSRRDEGRRSSSRRSDSEEESGYRRRSHRDEQKRSSSRRSEDERETSVSDAGKKREDSADVPDELRAKIRAMLMETL